MLEEQLEVGVGKIVESTPPSTNEISPKRFELLVENLK